MISNRLRESCHVADTNSHKPLYYFQCCLFNTSYHGHTAEDGHVSRREELEAIGFEFDADTAEWGFMYGRLQEAQQNLSGHDAILDGGFDFLLNNWCSVQRISNRSGMLSEKRRQLLNAVNFDWTGADALS